MKNKLKVGYFGGTFDPFHLGHLNLIVEVLEHSNLDKICVCPTPLSPFKIDAPPLAMSHRREMLKLALEGLPNVYIEELEAKNKKIAYTYDTLKELQSQDKAIEWTLILSDDLLKDFHQWKNAESLLSEFEVIVVERAGAEASQSKLKAQFKNKILQIRQVEVSSCQLRERLKNKLYCKHLVPLKVLDYIYKYKLYS